MAGTNLNLKTQDLPLKICCFFDFQSLVCEHVTAPIVNLFLFVLFTSHWHKRTRYLCNSIPCNVSYERVKLTKATHLYLYTRSVLVVFEGSRVLMLLPSRARNVSFLRAHLTYLFQIEHAIWFNTRCSTSMPKRTRARADPEAMQVHRETSLRKKYKLFKIK